MRTVLPPKVCGLFLATACILAAASTTAGSAPVVSTMAAMPTSPAQQSPGRLFGNPSFREADRAGRTRHQVEQDDRVVRSRFVSVDFTALGADDFDPGQVEASFARSVTLDLFDGDSLTFVQDHVELNPSGGFSWVGRAEERDDAMAVLAVRDGTLSGGVHVGDETYQISRVAGGAYAVAQMSGDELPPELPSIPFAGPRAGSRPVEEAQNVDLLVVYTAGAEASMGGQASMRAFVQQAVAAANFRFRSAGVETELNLVGSERVAYAETNDLRTDVRRLQGTSDGFLDDVHYQLRDAHAADVVHLVVGDPQPASCSLAYRMADDSQQFADWAFSVSELSCVGVTDALDRAVANNLGLVDELGLTRTRAPAATHFRTPRAGAPNRPELLEGDDLSWRHDPSARWYYVAVDGDQASSKQWLNATQVCSAGSCSAAAPQDAGDEFLWSVRPWNDRGNGPWSATMPAGDASGRDGEGDYGSGVMDRIARATADPSRQERAEAEASAEVSLSGDLVSAADDDMIESTANLLTDGNVHIPPNYTSMTPPSVGGTYVDPVFGTTIKRLSNSTSGARIVPEYSQSASFNLNDTYVALRHGGGGGYHLYNANGNHLGGLNVGEEPRWSRINPNWIYSHSSNRINRLDVSTGQSVTIGPSFSGGISFGNGQGDVSDNDRIALIRGDRYVSIFDLANGVQFTEVDSAALNSGFDYATVSKDGDTFVIGFYTPGSGRGRGVEQFRANGTFMTQLTNGQSPHGAMGRDVDGSAVFFFTNSSTAPQQPSGCDAGIVKVTLDGNPRHTCLVELSWGMGRHLSGHGGDGWVYLSTYQPGARTVAASVSDNDVTNDNNWHVYTNEILRVRADGSRVERLAHHRSRADSYWLQPHGNISPSGNMFVFGSDFHLDEHNDYADTYLIQVDGGGGGGGGGSPATPAAPSGLTATPISASRIDLAWNDNSNNETGFRLQRRSPNGSWATVTSPPANSTSYSDTGLAAGDWCYRIRSHNTNEAFSAFINASPACVSVGTSGPDAPTPPSNLSATARSSSRIDLSWNDNSNNETSFRLQRRANGGGSWTTAAWVAHNTTSYSDTGLAPGSWCYRVNAYNTANASSTYATSSPACLTIGGGGGSGPAEPAAPANLSATGRSSSRIDLTWNDMANNETSFRLQRRLSGGGWATAAWLPHNTTSYSDTGLPAGNWCYRINAYNTAAYSSSFATSSCVSIGGGGGSGLPSAPTNFEASASGSNVTLQWDSSGLVSSFKLQYAPEGTNNWTTVWIPANQRSYTHSPPNGDYCYRIRSHYYNAGSPYADSSPECVSVGFPWWCWWCGADAGAMSPRPGRDDTSAPLFADPESWTAPKTLDSTTEGGVRRSSIVALNRRSGGAAGKPSRFVS